MKNIEVLDVFIPAYLECALCSSTNDDGKPLDTLYNFRTDVSSEMCLRVIEDCTQFLMSAKPYLKEGVDLSQVGHDFWLTRNGHGAGFWDDEKRYGVRNAQKLTEISHSFGEIDLYVGDDNKLYFA